MAFKLTKDEQTVLDQKENDVQACKARQEEHAVAVRKAIDEYNEGLVDLQYAISEFRDTVSSIQGRLEDEFNEKSEKWQEGEKGTSVQEMIHSWEYLYDNLREPDDLAVPDFPHDEVDLDEATSDLQYEPFTED